MHLAAFSLISILGFLFLAGPELVEAESLHGDGPSAATFPKDGVATMKLNWNRGTPMAYGAFVGKGFEMTGRNPENVSLCLPCHISLSHFSARIPGRLSRAFSLISTGPTFRRMQLPLDGLPLLFAITQRARWI